MKNAIRLADSFAASKMTDKIMTALAQLEESMPDIDGEILSGVFARNKELRLNNGKKSQEKQEAKPEKKRGWQQAAPAQVDSDKSGPQRALVDDEDK